jgi:hypothetical protein
MASITKLPSGAYRVLIRRKGRYASETARRSDATARSSPPGGEPCVDQGLAPTSASLSRLQTFGGLIDRSIADMCEVGKPPHRRKAATLTTLRRNTTRRACQCGWTPAEYVARMQAAARGVFLRAG